MEGAVRTAVNADRLEVSYQREEPAAGADLHSVRESSGGGGAPSRGRGRGDGVSAAAVLAAWRDEWGRGSRVKARSATGDESGM